MQNQSIYETINNFNMIQVFYADPEVVNRASEFHLTSIDLFFKNVPDAVNNISGMRNPKATVIICDVENDTPVLTKCYTESRVTHASYKNEPSSITQQFPAVYDFIDASTPTVFSLKSPLKLRTDKFYGIIVIFDDPAFELWTNVAGDRITGSNTPSTGSSTVKDGKLFLRNNSGVFRSLSDTDLKFTMRVAKFVATESSDTYTNAPYEFFTVGSRVGNFIGGEKVFQRGANSTGTVVFNKGNTSIVGTATLFETLYVGDNIVVHGNATAADVVTIQSITNSTLMTAATPLPFTNTSGSKYEVSPTGIVLFKNDVAGKLFLDQSSANSAAYFTVNSSIVGTDSRATAMITSIDVLSVDRLRVKGSTSVPAGGTLKTSVAAAVRTGNSFAYDPTQLDQVRMNAPTVTDVTKYNGYVLSRSLEVTSGSMYEDANNGIISKSLVIQANLSVDSTNTNLFTTPSIGRGTIDAFAIQNLVANSTTYTEANSSLRNYGQIIDGEVGGSLSGQSRHIARKVVFPQGRFTEDLRVFMTAYRPTNTNIQVYARVHNSQDSEAFDDKVWTPLEYVSGSNVYSSSIDNNDMIEFELGLPQYSTSANVFPGTFTTQLGNSTILAAGANSAQYFQQNDVIKIYNPLIVEDYIIAVVNSVAVTGVTLTLGDAIANNNLVGTGFKADRVLYPYMAFNNITNDNVARYYSTTLVEYDKFDSMQIKVVFVSDKSYLVPRIDQLQVIGVSA